MKKSCVKFSASVPADVQDAFWINIFIFGVIFFFFCKAVVKCPLRSAAMGFQTALSHTQRGRERGRKRARERERKALQ